MASNVAPSKRPPPPEPNVKKAHTNPFLNFCSEQRPQLPKGLRQAARETLLGQLWQALSDADRTKYGAGAKVAQAPYNTFCGERRPLLPAGLRNAEREALLGNMWNALSKAERDKFSFYKGAVASRAPVATTTPSAPQLATQAAPILVGPSLPSAPQQQLPLPLNLPLPLPLTLPLPLPLTPPLISSSRRSSFCTLWTTIPRG